MDRRLKRRSTEFFSIFLHRLGSALEVENMYFAHDCTTRICTERRAWKQAGKKNDNNMLKVSCFSEINLYWVWKWYSRRRIGCDQDEEELGETAENVIMEWCSTENVKSCWILSFIQKSMGLCVFSSKCNCFARCIRRCLDECNYNEWRSDTSMQKEKECA